MPKLLHPSDLDAILNSIIDTTDHMLLAATSGEWDQVYELEGKRSVEIKVFFDRLAQLQLSDQDAAIIRQSFEQVMDKDSRIAALAEVNKKEVMQSLNELQSSRRAVGEYLQNESI